MFESLRFSYLESAFPAYWKALPYASPRVSLLAHFCCVIFDLSPAEIGEEGKAVPEARIDTLLTLSGNRVKLWGPHVIKNVCVVMVCLL